MKITTTDWREQWLKHRHLEETVKKIATLHNRAVQLSWFKREQVAQSAYWMHSCRVPEKDIFNKKVLTDAMCLPTCVLNLLFPFEIWFTPTNKILNLIPNYEPHRKEFIPFKYYCYFYKEKTWLMKLFNHIMIQLCCNSENYNGSQAFAWFNLFIDSKGFIPLYV